MAESHNSNADHFERADVVLEVADLRDVERVIALLVGFVQTVQKNDTFHVKL